MTAAAKPCVCRHLRTKALYVPTEADQAFADEASESSDGIYWCSLTQDQFGVDDQAALPATCRPGRSCFEG